ncbi:Dihydrolipoyllysine-residue acetyltransferase component of pyruvate dehydrogenase complex [compost metagenome]
MRREILVPKLGLTMSEGVLVEWMVAPGASFKANDGLFVIESEKAANEIGAEADGVLVEVAAQAGETLPCGAVIGYWDDGSPEGPAAVAPANEATPTAPGTPHSIAGAPAANEVARVDGRVPVTPLARRLAAQQGVDLATVLGSGPRGRIRARDVLASARQPSQAGAAPQAASAPQAGHPSAAPARAALPLPGTLRDPSSIERTMAQRLTAAKQQIPHFYLAVEAEMSAVMALRTQINASQTRQRLTLNHFVLAAVGQALEAMPELNRVWTEDGILSLADSDVGMAVNTEKGLLVPVLRGVGKLPLGGIARQAGELIGRAQAGRLASGEMQGGAFTVSNAGMHDVTWMTSIINPGQSMILGVGSIREVFRPGGDGLPVIRREMGMVLSADHRVLDGVAGLKFLKLVAQGLSQPLGLLVP